MSKRPQNKMNNSKQAKPKVNAPRRAKRPQVNSAPAATSQSLRPFTRFLKGPDSNSISMHTCVPICEILSVSNGTGGALQTATGTISTGITLSLTRPINQASAAVEFTSPVYDLISSVFTRYRVRKVMLHYHPQSSTTSVVIAGVDQGMPRLVFGFAEDPEHPLVMAVSQNSQNILALSDSIPFAPWNGWSLDVTQKLEAKKLYYTYAQLSDLQRFDAFGAITCVTDTTNAATHVGGVLYMETIIDLVEFCPITLTRPALADRTTPEQNTPPAVQQVHQPFPGNLRRA